MSSRKRARARTSVSVGSRAVAVAERGAPSRRASSPKNSPALTVAMMASSPSSDGRLIFTAPDGDHEQRVARIALVEQDLAAPEPAGAHLAGEPDEVVLAETGEQRAASERGDDRIAVDGGLECASIRASYAARVRPDGSPDAPTPRSACTCRLVDSATVGAWLHARRRRSATMAP